VSGQEVGRDSGLGEAIDSELEHENKYEVWRKQNIARNAKQIEKLRLASLAEKLKEAATYKRSEKCRGSSRRGKRQVQKNWQGLRKDGAARDARARLCM
jgi:hypothetical protein